MLVENTVLILFSYHYELGLLMTQFGINMYVEGIFFNYICTVYAVESMYRNLAVHISQDGHELRTL